MSAIQLHTATVPALAAPRGAQWAADVAARVFTAIGTLFAARPAAAEQTRFDEAEAVRRLADSLRDTDPGFAEDLYAAANRHESQA